MHYRENEISEQLLIFIVYTMSTGGECELWSVTNGHFMHIMMEDDRGKGEERETEIKRMGEREREKEKCINILCLHYGRLSKLVDGPAGG